MSAHWNVPSSSKQGFQASPPPAVPADAADGAASAASATSQSIAAFAQRRCLNSPVRAMAPHPFAAASCRSK